VCVCVGVSGVPRPEKNGPLADLGKDLKKNDDMARYTFIFSIDFENVFTVHNYTRF
jgi:hypothetical protein